MTAPRPFVSREEMAQRGLSIVGDPVTPQMPSVMQSIKNILAPQSTYMGQTIDRADSEAGYEMEGQLADECVKLFRSLGLRARTDHDITAGGTVEGWYVHIPNAKKNPYLLDYLILWHNIGAYCEIEIKSKSGAIRPIQKAILEHGGVSYLCRNIQEVKDALIDSRLRPNGVNCET
jgi:hypothetical protein